jgi:hypothetical protein
VNYDAAKVLAHPMFRALSPNTQTAYLALLAGAVRTGHVPMDIVDEIIARVPYGAAALATLQDEGLLSTEPADWAWWVRLPWIVEGAVAIEQAEWANR